MHRIAPLLLFVLLVAACADDDAEPIGTSPAVTTPATTATAIVIPPVVIADPTPGAGFPDGVWSGVIAADAMLLTVPGAASATTSSLYGTFIFTVEDGFGTGSYVITANQVIEAGADGAQGESVLSGVMEGSSASPLLIAEHFGFSGTATLDGVTTPFVFEQSFAPTTDVPEWTFEILRPDFVWGTVSLDDLVAATEASSGVDFSDTTTVFAAVPGEMADFDALVERVRELASIGG